MYMILTIDDRWVFLKTKNNCKLICLLRCSFGNYQTIDNSANSCNVAPDN